MLIIGPFLVGIYIKSKMDKPEVLAKKVVRANLILFDPLIALWSIWGLSLAGDMIYLPVAGLAMTVAGFFLGKFTARWITAEKKTETTYLIGSAVSNHGFTLGGLVCYLMAGEKGLGLSAIFISYFMPVMFIFIFPYAQSSSSGRFSLKSALSFFLSLQNLPLYAVISAVVLHAFRIPRPDIFFPIDVLLMISISLYYLTLGINFMMKDLFRMRKEYAFLAGIKFLLLPLLSFLVLRFVELNPDVETVIMIESFMPAAVYSVVVSILFDLDSRLASGMFVTSTVLFVIVVLPLLFLISGSPVF